MKELYDDLHRGCEIAAREYGELLDKVDQNGGKMSMADLEEMDKLSHMIKSNKTTLAMMDAEGNSYGDGSYGDGYGDGSYARRGRSYARRRDSMGRYSRRAYDDGMRDDYRA